MRSFVFISILLISFTSNSQDISHWEGHYSGTLQTESSAGISMSYHMELHIEPINDSTWNWTIVYGVDSLRQERKYLLKRTGQPNQFIINEQNTIILNLDLIGNSFYSVFEIEGSLLHVEYQWHKKEIIFILTSSANKSETGNGTHEGEEIPLVHTYKTGTVQYALLKRVKG